MSTVSFEIVLHVPSEYDYHYLIPDNIEKLIFYCFLSKQLNQVQEAKIELAKTVKKF